MLNLKRLPLQFNTRALLRNIVANFYIMEKDFDIESYKKQIENQVSKDVVYIRKL